MKIIWAVFELNGRKEITANYFDTIQEALDQHYERGRIIAFYYQQKVYYTHEGFTITRNESKEHLESVIARYKNYVVLPITYVYTRSF